MTGAKMEIESSRGMRIFWVILGLALAGGFIVGIILITLQSGPSPILWISSLFPIGIGVVAVVWLGRPAWIRVDGTTLSFVPPVGAAKVFPKSSVKWIARVPGSRGTSTIQLRDQDNRNLVKIEQGFNREDMEKLAQFLGAKFTWDLEWQKTFVAGMGTDEASRERALQQVLATMSPEERAQTLKHMKRPDGTG